MTNSDIISHSFFSSLRFRLGALTLGLVLSLAALVIFTFWAIQTSQGEELHAVLLGQTRDIATDISDSTEKFFSADESERMQLRSTLREEARILDRRLAVLRDGDPEVGISPLRDYQKRVYLEPHQRIWDDELRPLLFQLTGAQAPSEAELRNLHTRSQAWGSKLSENVDELTAEIEGTTRRYTIIFGGLILFGMVLASMLFVTIIGLTNRLGRLSSTTREIAGGNLDKRAPHDGSGDELTGLAISFNIMIDRLQEIIEEEAAARKKIAFEQAWGRATIDSAADGIITLLSDGTIDTLNRAACELLGAPAAKLVDRSVNEFVDLEVGSDLSVIYRGTSKARQTLEGRLMPLSSDQSIPITLRPSHTKVDGQPITVLLVQDIRKQRQAREERERLMTTIRELTAQLSSSTSELLATSAQQNAGSHQQLGSVTQTVATVEEVTATSEQAAQRAGTVAEAAQRAEAVGRDGQNAVQDTLQGLHRIRDRSEALAEKIVELAEQAGKIGSIIASVDHIAEQTNLLALNAAIEAARAGDAGRGFSVVAAEIKALAEQSRRATGEIQAILSSIERTTREAVDATEESSSSVADTIHQSRSTGETIDALLSTLTETARAATQILGSATQQATGINQIHDAMSDIEKVVQQNLASTAQAENSLGELTAMVERLEELLDTTLL